MLLKNHLLITPKAHLRASQPILANLQRTPTHHNPSPPLQGLNPHQRPAQTLHPDLKNKDDPNPLGQELAHPVVVVSGHIAVGPDGTIYYQ